MVYFIIFVIVIIALVASFSKKKRERERPPKSSDFKVEIISDTKDGGGMINDYQPPILNVAQKTIDDLNLLLSLYKKQEWPDWEKETNNLVKKLNNNAKDSVCPYCSATLDFKAVRVRKCPGCGEQMVAKKGYFLTTDRALKYKEQTEILAENKTAHRQLDNALLNAQNTKLNNYNNGWGLCQFYWDLAIAFENSAIFYDQQDEKGYSFWDKSWGYYNKTALAEGEIRHNFKFAVSRTPQLVYCEAQHFEKRAKHSARESQKNKMLEAALYTYARFFAEAVHFNDFYLSKSTIIKRCKELIGELKINNNQLNEIFEKAQPCNSKLTADDKEKLNLIKCEIEHDQPL
ncbi:MAG: hypothetical protein NTY30_00095 [Candidatus Berkelbacteria bacterium]|nr:hypothetical protein [Candidatus Berkelbacteria bacterium]